MLRISIVISFCGPVRDYRLHLHDVWCVCFYGIKWLTFKWVQLLILGDGEWCFLPALMQLSPLISGKGGKEANGSYLFIYIYIYKSHKHTRRCWFSTFISFLELSRAVAACWSLPRFLFLPNVIFTGFIYLFIFWVQIRAALWRWWIPLKPHVWDF